ncbi:MAG: right-handed parallel beta-helix repeat-containing protein [Candidatus Poribacteria bacterium]|nr:right-handed parallel beta-helix repeat-containing protein [Candidatus Poribacteria bacterium]
MPGTSRTEVHFTGLIWGGGLWSLRERIGARDADRIIFGSLSFLPRDGSANFQKGLTALLAADRSLFDVEHQDSIREVFNARGICEQTGCPLVSGVPTRSTISNQERLGVNQFTIEVPDDAVGLQVDLRAIQTNLDIDLYVRFDEPVSLRRFSTEVLADHRSEGEQGLESITITPGSSPSLQAGTYYIAIVNWTDQVRLIDYNLTATMTQSQSQDIPLTANVPIQGSIGPAINEGLWLLNSQYTIEIEDTTQRLDIVVTPDDPQQDLDFAVRFNERVMIDGRQVIADVIEQKLTGGGTITLTPPAVQRGTYYIAVGTFDRNPANFIIEVRQTDESIASPSRILTSGTPISGSSGPGNPPIVLWDLSEQYQIVVPNDATSLSVELAAEDVGQDIDLVVRHGEPVGLVNRRLITDFLEESFSGRESILVNSETTPRLRAGTYYIAVGNISTRPANWTLTATVSTIRVSLTPTIGTVEVGDGLQFNATVTGTGNPTVIWWVNEIRGGNEAVGTIDSAGLYTAPALVPDINPVTIRAVSLVDQTQSASALVTIVPLPDRYTDLQSGVPVEGEIGPGIKTPRKRIWELSEQFRITVPDNAQELIVTVAGADATINLDFAIRFDRRITKEGGEIIADFIDDNPESGGTHRILAPELRAGVYHIAVGNFGLSPTTFTVTATMILEPQMLRVAQDGSADFTSIGDALEVAQDRATIEIRDDGVYTENVVLEQNWMTLRAASGRTPTIDGNGFSAILIDSARAVTVSGLSFINGAPAILLFNSVDCIIEGNSISRSTGEVGDGICLRSTAQTTIRNNQIFDNERIGFCAFDSSVALIDIDIRGTGMEGVFISSLDELAAQQINESAERTLGNHASRIAQYALRGRKDTSRSNLQAQSPLNGTTGAIEIRGNRILDNTGAGIVLIGELRGAIEGNRIERNDDPDAQDGFDGGILIADVIDRLAIRNNVIDTNGNDGLLIFGSPVELINNQVTRNGGSGVTLSNGVFQFSRAAQVTVINTTIAGNHSGVSVARPPIGAFRSELSIVNSIIVENDMDLVDVELAAVRFSLIGDDRFVGQSQNIGGEPAFADSAGGNYQLSNASPAIDVGTSKLDELSELDLLGNPRIFDGDGDGNVEVDLGAYEFQGGQPAALEITPSEATAAVNQVLEFSATLIETTDQRVVWRVNGIPSGDETVGMITPDGVYTAPAAVPETNPVTVEAISLLYTSISATATVTITPSQQLPFVLTSGVPVEGELLPGNPLRRTVKWKLEDQYQISVAENATELVVQLEGENPSQDIDLAVRHNRPIQIRGGRLVKDFLAETSSASETIRVNLTTNPPIQSGIYFITAGNFDVAPARYTLVATVRTDGRPGVATPLRSGEAVNGTVGRASPPDLHLWDVDNQYTIDLPPEATELTVELAAANTPQNVNLALRFGQKSTIEGSVFIADIKSQNPDGRERLQLTGRTAPPLQAGTYYITIGNFEASSVDFTLTATVSETPIFPPWDVNEDGVTDIADLVVVGRQFGAAALTNPRADVNGDGGVDVLDFVVVASHFGERSENRQNATPTVIHSPASARVWLEPYPTPDSPPGVLQARLRTSVIGGAIYGGRFNLSVSPGAAQVTEIQRGAGVQSDQRVYWQGSKADNEGTDSANDGIAFTHLRDVQGIAGSVELAVVTLQVTDLRAAMLSIERIQLVDASGSQIHTAVEMGSLSGEAMLIPNQSVLLPNYPNPFNPETWMPYQLAKPAHVRISIYDARGVILRQLDVGHRAAGSYLSRHRAAYWDGRNRYGERVSSGVYFYYIEAGDFHATRKMSVVK